MSLFCFRGRLLLQDMYIDVDCGSSFFSFLCKTHDHKNSGPCLSLATIMSMWLHSSFKGLISSLKFDCSSEEGSQGNKSVFQSSQSSSKRHQSFVLHILLFHWHNLTAISKVSWKYEKSSAVTLSWHSFQNSCCSCQQQLLLLHISESLCVFSKCSGTFEKFTKEIF